MDRRAAAKTAMRWPGSFGSTVKPDMTNATVWSTASSRSASGSQQSASM